MRAPGGRGMRRALPLLALVAAGAQAARPPCVQPDDLRVILRLALPDAMESLAARCRPVLPADAFLPARGPALAARYRREAPVDPARARAAITAATGQDFSNFADDGTVATIAAGFIDDEIADRVPTRHCDAIDGLVQLAAPLRADAMTDAILLILETAGPARPIKGLAICRPDAESAR